MRWQRPGLPSLILYLTLAMIAAGIMLHGVRPAGVQRGWENLLARPNQSLAPRFIFQPLMATLLAIRDGIKDARSGRSPYFWTVVWDPAQRSARLHEGIVATGKIFLIAIAVDVAYQLIELQAFYPGEAVTIAIILAFLPYLIVRGPAARLARRWLRVKVAKPEA
jgi:hypothetical protein